MKNKLLYLMPLMITVLISFILLTGVNNLNNKQQFKALIGENLPNFALKSLYQEHNFLHNIKEDIFILHVFSSWCQNCITEHKKLFKLAKSVPIYAIATQDENINIKKMLNNFGNPFKDVAVDSNGNIAIELGVRAIPETIIIQDNRIIDRFSGKIDNRLVKKYFSHND